MRLLGAIVTLVIALGMAIASAANFTPDCIPLTGGESICTTNNGAGVIFGAVAIVFLLFAVMAFRAHRRRRRERAAP